MPVTPMIRDFLVQLEDLLDRTPAPNLDRDRVTINTADAVALVTLPHKDGAEHDVELEVHDRVVVVSYGGEPLHLRDRGFTLQFVEALLAGRVDIEVHRGLLWRTTRSYLDERPRAVPRHPHARAEPLAAHRPPARRLRLAGTALASASIFTPGPIVDEVVMPRRYLPFDDAGLALTISSSTAP